MFTSKIELSNGKQRGNAYASSAISTIGPANEVAMTRLWLTPITEEQA
jgi:hypothetical protein